MMSIKEQNAALVLINMQKAFDEEEYWGGNRNNKDAETNASAILKKWRTLNLPVFHVVHSSQNPKSLVHESHPGFEIKDELTPINGEAVILKKAYSAFIGTGLQEKLEEQAVSTIVIVGMTTNYCISSSARMAGDLGFDSLLISDAIAAFDTIGMNGEKISAETIHQTSLASLNNDFAQVIDTKKLLELVE